MQLREFALRFNECLGLKRVILEKLEDFGEFDENVAKGSPCVLVRRVVLIRLLLYSSFIGDLGSY